MNFGVNDRLAEIYPQTQYGKNPAAGQKGASDFADQLAAARSTAASNIQSAKGASRKYN